ncbi:MAG: trypsin-like peptidase domain-containing protein [Verrucomicrobiota bacterium]
MNLHFKCPNCGLEMLAETSNVGGTGQCPSCGQEFVVAATPQPLPVVTAQVVGAGPRPTLAPHAGPGHPPVAMPRPGLAGQQRHAPPAFAQRQQDSSDTKDKILIASVLIGGGLLVFGLLWMMQHANQNPAPPTPPPTAPTGAGHAARDKDVERLEAKQKELEKEVERGKLIRDKQEQAEQEENQTARVKLEAEAAMQRTKMRKYYATRLFEGDETAAGAFITELENIRNDVALLPENAKERSSAEEADKFVAARMIERAGKNSILYHWLEDHGRKPEDLVPGLAGKNPNSADGSPGASFDFSRYAAFGSGFWVSADGWLLTNHHVVNAAKSVELRMRDGTIIQATVVKTDTVNDLALLKAASMPPSWLPVSKGEAELKLGQTVFTIGYPNPQVQGLEPKFTDGRISSVTGIADSKNHYQTTVPVQHGNSGGPLVDLKTGWVVGVVNSRLEDSRSGTGIANVSYAIKGNVAWTFLASVPEAKLAVERKPAAAIKQGDERAVIDRVKDAAILILDLR